MMMDREYRIKLAMLRKPSSRPMENATKPPTEAAARNMEIIKSRRRRTPNPPAPDHHINGRLVIGVGPGTNPIPQIIPPNVTHTHGRHSQIVHAHVGYQQASNSPVPVNQSILLTGGIGDIFAVESFFSDQQRADLSTILYATNKHEAIKPLFESLPNYPNLKNHNIVWSDFNQFWCFLYKHEVMSRLGTNTPPELAACEDWGIIPKFHEINRGRIAYNGSSFINHTIGDITKFPLPSKYIVISPFSTDKRLGSRDFTQQDWGTTLKWLAAHDLNGVVINRGDDKVPVHSRLLDLSNHTTVVEAVEILKKGRGYIGIDSWLSVLAAKIFDSPYIAIKSNNNHCYDNKHIYFAPKKTFEFINGDLGKLLKM